jgi:hypothetical protein
MSTLENLKEIADLVKKLGNIELYRKIVELEGEVIELTRENHDLKERLRFKSGDFEFKNPFWYEKAHPDRPLCAKCFATRTVAPMSELYRGANEGVWRKCLVCSDGVQIAPPPSDNYGGPRGPRSDGPWG